RRKKVSARSGWTSRELEVMGKGKAKGEKAAAGSGLAQGPRVEARKAVSDYPRGRVEDDGVDAERVLLLDAEKRDWARVEVLPEWEEKEEGKADEGAIAQRELVIGCEQAFEEDSELEWRPAAQVFDQVALHEGDDQAFEVGSAVAKSHNGEIASLLAVSQLFQEEIGTSFLWDRIEPRESPATDGEENSRQVFAVKVFIDGEPRQILVDDQVVVNKTTGTVISSCIVHETTLEEAQVEEGAEHDQGKDTGTPSEVTTHSKAFLWPCILEKVLHYLERHTNHAPLKRSPFSLFNEWICTMQRPVFACNKSYGSDDVPRDIDWSRLRKPKRSKFYFKSWDDFIMAKAEATKADDPQALGLLEAAEKDAQERKAAHEHAAEEERLRQQEEAEAAADQPDAEAAGAPRPRISKKRSKRKGKRDPFLPFDQSRYDAASQAYETYLSSVINAFAAKRSRIDLVETSAEGLVVSARMTRKLESVASSLEEGEANHDLRARIELYAAAEWWTGECMLLPKTAYAVKEINQEEVCLHGVVGSCSGQVDPSVDLTFWLSLESLMLHPSLRWSVFKPVAASMPRAVLHDHLQVVDATQWKRSCVGNCTAFFIQDHRSQQEAQDGIEEPAVESVPVTIVLSADACCLASSQSVTMFLQKVAHQELGDFLQVFRRPGVLPSKDLTQFVVDLRKGIDAFEVEVEPGALYVCRLVSAEGASVQIWTHSEELKPVFEPLLQGWKSLNPAHDECCLKTVSQDFPSTWIGDWQVAARYSFRSQGNHDADFSVAAQLSLDDSKTCRCLFLFMVNKETGETRQLNTLEHNGEWAAPVTCEPTASYELVLVVESTDRQHIPAGTFVLRVASNAPIEDLQAKQTQGLQKYTGTYLPNRSALLFRDYLETVPGSLSLRLETRAAHPDLVLELVLQDVQQQLNSCAIGTPGDRVLASARTCKHSGRPDSKVADLHWTPGEIAGCGRTNETQRLVLQGRLAPVDQDRVSLPREPYWELEQVPIDDLAVQEQRGAEIIADWSWELFVVSSQEPALEFYRETAWEEAIRAYQATWETGHPGRRESGTNLRRHFVVNGFFAVPEGSESDVAESSGNASPGHRNNIRMASRQKLLSGSLDEDGQLKAS
ncbi:Hypothetical protein (Fragment), partial [Durusdinium trenchii]